MKRIILVLLITATTGYSQGMINIQPGTGVPTDMAIGGLLGAILAPMISKGSDAKLVGGLLGATAGGMYGTANNQMRQQQTQQIAVQQDQQIRYAFQQQQMQIAAMQQQINQMAQMNTASGGNSYGGDIKMGIIQGGMVKSPYSKFKVDPKSMNLDNGDVMYDPFNGKPFRIP